MRNQSSTYHINNASSSLEQGKIIILLRSILSILKESLINDNDNHEEHKALQIQDKKNISYEIGNHVDCKDTVNHWLNAEIIEVYWVIFCEAIEVSILSYLILSHNKSSLIFCELF